MSVDYADLGKRAVASPHWAWMIGMRAHQVGRIIDLDETNSVGLCESFGSVSWRALASQMPRLYDPATLGCVTQLVREAWGDRDPYVVNDSGHPRGPWFVMTNHSDAAPCIASGATEGEALIKALEAAPSVKR